MVADTPENLRLKQQSELQSQVSARVPPRPGVAALSPRRHPTFSQAPVPSRALAERRVWGAGPSSRVSPVSAVFAVPFVRALPQVGRVQQALLLPLRALHRFIFSLLPPGRPTRRNGLVWAGVGSVGEYFG